MSIFVNQKQYVERNGRSAIHSHQEGFGTNVESICHHSGRYLTKNETNPTRRTFLKIQSDFPRLPKLDAFYNVNASHSIQHEHWIWSKHAVQGLALILVGLGLIFLVIRNENLSDFLPGGLWISLFWIVLVLAFLSGAGMTVYGLIQILRRVELFHKEAEGLPPAIREFPLQCTYEIAIEERVEAVLGNVVLYPNIVQQNRGTIKTIISPTSEHNYESFEEYKKVYEGHDVGKELFAGAIGLEELDGISFESNIVEFDHRIVLKIPSEQMVFDKKREEYRNVSFLTEYSMAHNLLHPVHDGLRQFPLQCIPSILHHESRTLQLKFRFITEKTEISDRSQFVLQECILDQLSDRFLMPVAFVRNGRFDTINDRVIWRNLPFQQIESDTQSSHQIWELNVGVTFEYPILNCPEQLCGSYKIKSNHLISNLNINTNNVWTAWGARAKSSDILIRTKSHFYGNLQIDPQLLSQKHEHITNIETIICKSVPNEHLVQKVLNVVQDQNFEIHKITKAHPRLHPTGRLDAQLQYWDIVGRRYNENTLDAIDLHLIISGHQDISQLSTKAAILPQTQIDLRLRCLHDPRNLQTPHQADTLGGVPTYQTQADGIKSPAIPPYLRNHMREVLLNCGPFNNQEKLQNVFVDSTISEWKDELPEAQSRSERVDKVISFLSSKRAKSRKKGGGENGLILLLNVLQNRHDANDDCHNQLGEMIVELSDLFAVDPGLETSERPSLESEPQGLVNQIHEILNAISAEVVQ